MEFLNRVIRKVLILIHKIFNWRRYKEGVILYGIPRMIYRDRIRFRRGVRINEGVFLHGAGGIQIGENVTLSYGVTILSTGYDTEHWESNNENKKHVDRPVVIGENCWLCGNVTILDGVQIAKKSIIAAGAVVTKNLEDEGCLYGGVPARKIKKL